MKAATGELNLTVITLIAIAAVLGFFWAMWPTIKGSITQSWNNVNEAKDNTDEKYYDDPESYKQGEGFIVGTYQITF